MTMGKRGSGKRKSFSEVQGQSPGRGLGDDVPQKLKQYLLNEYAISTLL